MFSKNQILIKLLKVKDTTEGENTVWKPANKTRNMQTICKGFKQNHSYRFRVKAENEIGVSEPGLLPGGNILMEDRQGNFMNYSRNMPNFNTYFVL